MNEAPPETHKVMADWVGLQPSGSSADMGELQDFTLAGLRRLLKDGADAQRVANATAEPAVEKQLRRHNRMFVERLDNGFKAGCGFGLDRFRVEANVLGPLKRGQKREFVEAEDDDGGMLPKRRCMIVEAMASAMSFRIAAAGKGFCFEVRSLIVAQR